MGDAGVVATTNPGESRLALATKRTVVVPCALGLHLRVAALVVTLARQFESAISFRAGRRQADAKSIWGMMCLGAVRGKRLTLVACGPDADRAAQVIGELFESKEVLCKEERLNDSEVRYGRA